MSGDTDRNNGGDGQTGVIVRSRTKTKKPAMYKVLMLNDDYTPMEFVVHVLEQFFSMDRETAVRVMLQIHTQGKGVCGIFSREIAETKVAQVNAYSQENKHPLLCTMERA